MDCATPCGHYGPVEFISSSGFPAEQVTSLLADWDDAPGGIHRPHHKLALHRPPLDLGGS